jgi:guanosine-3',5'-bis(diphosphate) 3'-pyrophosphohydrolase
MSDPTSDGFLARVDAYAELAHAGQFRRSLPGVLPAPYITHPRAVRDLLASAGISDPVILAAALLHDTVEDCGETRYSLAAAFGYDVANLVIELTNDPDRLGPLKHASQVEHAAVMSEHACWIKTADKTAVLTDLVDAPPDWDAARMIRYTENALLVFNAMPFHHADLSRNLCLAARRAFYELHHFSSNIPVAA